MKPKSGKPARPAHDLSPRYAEFIGCRKHGLVARIHRCDGMPLEIATAIPKHIIEKRAKEKLCKKSLVQDVSPQVVVQRHGNKRPEIQNEHHSRWIEVDLGDGLVVGILPAKLTPILDTAHEAYRARMVELAGNDTPPSKGGREIERATLAQVLKALLPAPSTLAININNQGWNDSNMPLRVKVARMIAGYSTRQLERAVRVTPHKGKNKGKQRGLPERQLRRFEEGKEGMPEEHLRALARILLPDAFMVGDSPQTKMAGMSCHASDTSAHYPPHMDPSQAQAFNLFPFLHDRSSFKMERLPVNERVCDWLTCGGFAWWWSLTDEQLARRSDNDLSEYLGLPCWSGTLIRPFVTWLRKNLTKKQRLLVKQRQVVPEVTETGEVILRRFRLLRVEPIMAVYEMSLMPTEV